MPNLTCLGVKVLDISDKPKDLAVVLEDGRCLAVPASWIQRPKTGGTPA